VTQIPTLWIDLGKNSYSVVGLDDSGRVVVRRRMHRVSVIKFAGGLMPCVVAMEAYCGTHHLGRLLWAHGHEIRLMSPEYVRPVADHRAAGTACTSMTGLALGSRGSR
jgi:transposase